MSIGAGNLTLLDVAKMTRPDGSVETRIIEALTQRNPILKDAPAIEGNLTTGHRLGIEAGLPTVGYRLLNQGIAGSKGTQIQVDETCALLEGRSVVDRELCKLGGNEAAVRANQDRKFMSALNNQAATSLIYASTQANPEQFLGWTPRYNALTGFPSSVNVVNAVQGGTAASGTDQASMLFITWGEDTAHLIYPKGTMAGIEHVDMGLDYEDDGTGTNAKFLAWRTHWIWRLGLCIPDWRYHARICNIDTSSTGVQLATETRIISAMIEAYNRIRDFNSGTTVIYTNRTVVTLLDKQIMNKANYFLTNGEWHGRPVTMFRGLPILMLDAMTSTESIVT